MCIEQDVQKFPLISEWHVVTLQQWTNFTLLAVPGGEFVANLGSADRSNSNLYGE